MAITTEQVHAAADAITARGERPTLTAVRRELGGGSFSTISEAMQAWRARQQEEASAQGESEIPEPVREQLASCAAAVWEAALAEAEQRFAAEREALHQARAQADAEVAEAQEAVRTLEAEAEEKDRRIAALERERDEQAQRAETAESELMTLRERLQQREEQIRSLEGRAETAEARLDRLIERLGDEDSRDA